MLKLNNKGLTLVEIVLAILILGISSLMLATTFSSAMRILNRATLYKNMSTSAAATVELESSQDSLIPDEYEVSDDSEDANIKITYIKEGVTYSGDNGVPINGRYFYGIVNSDSSSAHITYKEFQSGISSNDGMSYDILDDVDAE